MSILLDARGEFQIDHGPWRIGKAALIRAQNTPCGLFVTPDPATARLRRG